MIDNMMGFEGFLHHYLFLELGLSRSDTDFFQ